MLFIMEGIDLAGVVDSDFQGIQINFAPPCPTGFANFRGAGQDLLFAGRDGVALFPRFGAGRKSLASTLEIVTRGFHRTGQFFLIFLLFLEF